MKKKDFTVKKRLQSFRYAWNGIKLLVCREPNARIHCFAAICVVLAGCFFHINREEWVAVMLAIGGVFAAEAINSSIETLADLVSPEYNEAVKHTKDLAAGAVLLIAIAAAITGCIIFIPYISEYLH